MPTPDNIKSEILLLGDLQSLHGQRLYDGGTMERVADYLDTSVDDLLDPKLFKGKPRDSYNDDVRRLGLTVRKSTPRLSPSFKIVPICEVVEPDLVLPLHDFTVDDAELVLGGVSSLVQDRDWGLLPHLSDRTYRMIEDPFK